MLDDVRYALRQLLRRPGYALIATMTIAAGIAATAGVFSIVKSVLIEPLPHASANRLVVLSPYPWTHVAVTQGVAASGHSLDAVAGYYPQQFALAGGNHPVEIEGARVSPGFFSVLGIDLAAGRFLAETDGPAIAVISHALRQRHFAGEPEVIGRTLSLNGVAHEIVGVAAPGSELPLPRLDAMDVWVPLDTRAVAADGSPNWMIPVARLREGAPVAAAQAELDQVVARYTESGADLPRSDYDWMPMRDALVGDAGGQLLMLQLAVALVLLLACANVANLQIARFSASAAQMSLRVSLGATRGRIYRQVLAESALLCVAGGMAGLILLALAMNAVVAIVPAQLQRVGDISLDTSVLLFALAASLLVGLASGLLPAVMAARAAPARVLNDGARAVAGSHRKRGASEILVVVQVVLTLVLLTGASLLVRSYIALSNENPGFDSDNVLVMPVQFAENRHRTVPELESGYRRLVERLQHVPGVESVAIANRVPLSRSGTTRLYRLEGEAEPRQAQHGIVSPGYLETLGMPLLRGRFFDGNDRRGNRLVAVIDEAFRQENWPGEDPVGRRMLLEAGGDDHWLTVIGVAGNIRGSGLGREPEPGFYISYLQRPDTGTELAVGRRATFLLAASAPLDGLAPMLRAAVWEVAPDLPVPEITRLDDVLSASVEPQRFRARLTGAFAALALILAVAGVYGVASHLVAGRVHEFAVRKSVGASDRDIGARVLAWAAKVIFAGAGIGLVAVLAFGRVLETFLHGVSAADSVTVLAALGAVSVAVLIAAWGPARRAARVEPMQALRDE